MVGACTVSDEDTEVSTHHYYYYYYLYHNVNLYEITRDESKMWVRQT